MKQMDILGKSESYCKSVILIEGGSTLIDMIILLITPIYLEKELNASTSIIGTALSLIVGIYTFSVIIIPYIAESNAKYLKHVSYGTLFFQG